MKVIKMKNKDDIQWKKVFMTQKPIQAEIVAGNLENNGITVVTINKRDSSYTAFGWIELMVPEDEYEMAMQLITEAKDE